MPCLLMRQQQKTQQNKRKKFSSIPQKNYDGAIIFLRKMEYFNILENTFELRKNLSILIEKALTHCIKQSKQIYISIHDFERPKTLPNITMPPIIQVIILIEKGSSTSTQIYSGATIEKNLPITIRKSVNSDDEQDIFVEWEIDILKNLDPTKLSHPSDLLFFLN
jgi:hypothetical protein